MSRRRAARVKHDRCDADRTLAGRLSQKLTGPPTTVPLSVNLHLIGRHKLRRRGAWLAAAALCAGLSLLFPLAAASGQARHGRATAHLLGHRRCAAKPSGRVSKTARGGRGRAGSCATAHALRQRRPRAGGSLEATPLNPATGTAPGVGTRGAEAAAPPAGGTGTSGEPVVKPPRSSETLPLESGEVVGDPIDTRFLTLSPFGTTSFWTQPWRAYLDTWPASRLLESVGINFNVRPDQAEATAQLLHDNGFKLARVGTDWAALSYSDPTKFNPTNLASLTARLSALHNHGLRPLLVLEAYSGAPCPEKHAVLETTVAAPAGAQSVQLTPASAALVVPRKTGFNGLVFEGTPDILITSVSAGGLATLSRPLLSPLAAGPHGGTTILYEPFGPPTLATGAPNPAFQATLAGWLNYVGQISKLAASIVGPGGFDLEVWNELTFGSQFLNIENYYRSALSTLAPANPVAATTVGRLAAAPARAEEGGDGKGSSEGDEAARDGLEEGSSSETGPDTEAGYDTEPAAAEDSEGGGGGGAEGSEAGAAPIRFSTTVKGQVSGEIRRALLNATVAYVRDPLGGISPAVGITNGFASETPFPSGASAPLGLTALSKHPYEGKIDFPAEYRENGAVPRNALGERDTISKTSLKPLFIPTYQSLLPEYMLTATGAETLIRDLAPFTTYVYGFPHGRYVGPVGGPPPQKWVTEYNLGIGKAPVMGPDGVTPQTGASATLSAADKAHFHAKALLRSLVSMIGKGMSREYFFGAAHGAFSLIGDEFFSALEAHPGTYPGDQLGGEVMHAFSRTLARFQGSGPTAAAQQLTLLSIAQDGTHAQFAGDGTNAHPTLYDHSVLAVLPFQSSPTRFVIPFYVMTRDMLTLYEPGASPSDLGRFDLPDETFRITLGNLPETSAPPTVGAYDPLRDANTPAQLVSRAGNTAVFELAVSDYPRLLTLEYPAG